MRTPARIAAAALCPLLPAGLAAGQTTTLTASCAGASISTVGTPADIVRSSATGTSIAVAPGYQFAFNPVVSGVGLGSFIGTNVPLGDVLNGFVAGGQRTLYGAVRAPAGGWPTRLDTEPVGGTFSGLSLSFTLQHEILPDGRVQAAIRSIQRPFLFGLSVNSGGLVVSAWTPPAPRVSEWHLDGDLRSVRDTGLAPASGPARLRYLDDPAFGPLLGGDGALDVYPTTPTPTGVTQAQSAFGTVASFGLPPLPGAGGDDVVYRTSPPRNAANPSGTPFSRGVGLTLWPNSRDYWPEDRHGQWTMVWDLFIPAASWEAARTSVSNVAVPLVETSANNNSAADLVLKVTGAAPGAATAGIRTPLATPTVGPGRWFRLAVAVDHYAAFAGRVYVDGVRIAGTTQSDWVYTACRSTDPRWGNVSQANPSGTAVPAATWDAWGRFPSPWAQQTVGGNPPVYTFSTLSLFADLFGAGESVYVANMLFTDEAMTDAQIAALGGPSGRGIVHLKAAGCRPDFNGQNGADLLDIFAFLEAWFNGCTGPGAPVPACTKSADYNGQNGVDLLDIFAFLTDWFAGC